MLSGTSFLKRVSSSFTVPSLKNVSWNKIENNSDLILHGKERVDIPFIRMSPEVGKIIPLISLKIVDFPAPLLPLRTILSLLFMTKLKFLITGAFFSYSKNTFLNSILYFSQNF